MLGDRLKYRIKEFDSGRLYMKKICLIYLVITTLIFISACSNSNEINSEENEQIEQAINLKDTKVEFDKFSFQLIGYKIIDSENDVTQDALSVFEFIQDANVDNMQLGFDIGFNSSNEEVTKRDSYLIIILEYSLNIENASQRDSIIPKMNISATDNFEDDLILLHNSMKDKYIQIDNPIGVFVFKTFKDSKTIYFEINNKEYYLELDQ